MTSMGAQFWHPLGDQLAVQKVMKITQSKHLLKPQAAPSQSYEVVRQPATLHVLRPFVLITR